LDGVEACLFFLIRTEGGMAMMKTAEYDPEVDDVRITEAPVPKIGEGEILLRPRSVGLCASELISSHLKKGGSLGHELAGSCARSEAA